MAASWIAGGLWHPFALTALALVVGCSIAILVTSKRPAFTLPQLIGGFAGILVAVLFLSAASSYVPPEETVRVWKVPASEYWDALLESFLTLFTLMAYVALVGAALVGVPILAWLACRGYKQVHWMLLASIAISIFALCVLAAFGSDPPTRVLRDAPFFIGSHLVLTVGFCLGARLPWRGNRAVAV